MTSKFVTLKLGIKNNSIDGLLIKLPSTSSTAMISTKNKFAAAPVILSRKNIKTGRTLFVFINSGNANACTGKIGLENCNKILLLLSEKLACNKEDILVMSTGIIGRQLPMKNIIKSIQNSDFNKYSSIKNAATAIMTTDKFPKYLTKAYNINNKRIIFKGICKGAGMIEPNMATMLSFIETNAHLSKSLLMKYLKQCADLSFNSISVDGDMSTNDTVVFSSCGDIKLNFKNKSIEKEFISCASDFFVNLSNMIVKDGEGATKIIKLNIINAKNQLLALSIGRKISNSLLVKTAMYGADPNWGRIIASLGSIDSQFINPNKNKLLINDILCFRDGVPVDAGSKKLTKSMKKKNIEITLDLHNGNSQQSIYFSDLSHEYISINSEYTT
ncbi:MAG: bifunctional glutamate N-acetyltransferase/amino-acid acetyltransferase ArgJ [Gammaproteobacteria bacterium]